MTDEVLRTQLNFKAYLHSLYTTPFTYKFPLPQDRNFDQFVAYASKNLEQFSFWQQKRIRFFQFQFNFSTSIQHHHPNTLLKSSNIKSTVP